MSSASKQAYNRARYKRLRAENRCVQCTNQDERTLNGFSTCEVCRQKFEEYRNRPEVKAAHKAQASLNQSRKYYECLENHCCTRCRTKLPRNYYYTQCEICREYFKTLDQKKKTAKRGNA
ncbi:MAG: hypothetical protein U0M60_19040 [Clostridia bacterium]|nr:hypothetical protein [Acutalibacteraceae bacterium]MEE1049501.1 hypothetical protein [Clostridia bacterium]